MPPLLEKFIHEEEEVDHPMRYLPIRHVYSSTTPCVSSSGSSNVVSKKVKARKLIVNEEEVAEDEKQLTNLFHGGLRWGNAGKPIFVYSRRPKKPREMPELEVPVNHSYPVVKSEIFSDTDFENDKDKENEEKDPEEENDANLLGADGDPIIDGSKKRNRRMVKFELRNLGAVLADPDGDATGESRRRGSRRLSRTNLSVETKMSPPSLKDSSDTRVVRKWVELDFEGADPHSFVGLACKVFWPLDDEWYKGSVLSYDSNSHRHHIKYNDGDEEHIFAADEKIHFHVSSMDIQRLNLKKKELDHYEMLSLAVISEDCDVPEPGDVVWAKLTGHAVWPALIVNEPCAGGTSGPKREQSFFVQFFGTHNFARVSLKQVMPFGKGVHCSLDLKCKQGSFIQSLDEVKLYLSNQQLPERMLRFQKATDISYGNASSDENQEGASVFENLSGNEAVQPADECIHLPIEVGNLRVTCLGSVIHDSAYFHGKHHVWPVGYTAYRKFASVIDPSMIAVYKMEVLRNPKSISRPLFRVTTDDGEQIDGSSPIACWKEIYERIRCLRGNGSLAEVEECGLQKSGTYMFGFSVPLISKLIQCRSNLQNGESLPPGYRAVRIEWKDLDRCNVCHMDEEYEGNLFLQCDKCRMMVHARCYGELEPMDEELWHCKLCRNGAPRSSPPCCLCPVIGGAMKPTTDGQWAHLACAIWIPETCLSDVKKMEPIDGINRIHKDRWKLLCSICHVTYGACIQCSNNACCTAYHPLCARAAGYCVELEDEDKIHLMSLDDDDDQCIRLVSFCKKHSQPSSERNATDEGITLLEKSDSCYVHPSNLSGCARTEPYKFERRNGQKVPQILTPSTKRSYVENRPYLVTGYCQNSIASESSRIKSMQTICSSRDRRPKIQPETSVKVSSMSEKYKNMKSTFRARLVFGKSRIHGFGVFAKLPHRAGDMVIEYSGELVRPSIADIREHCIYNSLVGAGTYMFRIDNERVIDATKAGSIAHLINHSCEPNCYSRVISVNGDEHIIIFAKRDIGQWEELTYDYRFFSKDELACYCGFPRCRGIVNDAEERIVEIEVPKSDLIHCDDE